MILDEQDVIQLLVAEPTSQFDLLKISVLTPEGTVYAEYDILATGLTSIPIPVGYSVFIIACVTNIGTAPGSCTIECYVDTTLLWSWTGILAINGASGALSMFVGAHNPLVMPDAQVTVSVKAGHD